MQSSPNITPAAESLYFDAIDHLAEGRPADAVAAFRAALVLAPEYLDAEHGLIRALQAAGEFDAGIVAAQQLIAREPDDVLAYTSLSILYQHKGMVPEAEAAGTKAKILGWKQQLKSPQPKSASNLE